MMQLCLPVTLWDAIVENRKIIIIFGTLCIDDVQLCEDCEAWSEGMTAWLQMMNN